MMIEEISKFVERMHINKKIAGWLSFLECLTLYLLAKDTKGQVVEIGSFMGKSTFWLAKAMKDTNGERVIAIDPHVGSKEILRNVPNFPKEGSFPEFQANMEATELSDWINPMVMTSEEASKKFEGEVSLLFIDGSHEYKDVKLDAELWLPKLKKGGIVAFHDSNWEGPAQVIKEHLTPDKFELKKQIDSITIARRK